MLLRLVQICKYVNKHLRINIISRMLLVCFICYNILLQYIIYIILHKKKGLEIYVNTKKVIPHKQYSKEKKH